MTIYGSVAGVERKVYLITGKPFTATQITIVEGLLGDAHGVIVGNIGFEPASTAELADIENTIVYRWFWNKLHEDQPPLGALSIELGARLNIARTEPTEKRMGYVAKLGSLY